MYLYVTSYNNNMCSAAIICHSTVYLKDGSPCIYVLDKKNNLILVNRYEIPNHILTVIIGIVYVCNIQITQIIPINKLWPQF